MVGHDGTGSTSPAKLVLPLVCNNNRDGTLLAGQAACAKAMPSVHLLLHPARPSARGCRAHSDCFGAMQWLVRVKHTSPAAADCAADRSAVAGSPGGEGCMTSADYPDGRTALSTAVTCEASASTANEKGTEGVVVCC